MQTQRQRAINSSIALQEKRLYLLAFAQGIFHAVASKFLIVVDEGEGQVYVQWVGSVRGCSSLPGFECNHEVDPGSRPLDFELVNEILTKNPTKQLLKLIIYPQRTIGTT